MKKYKTGLLIGRFQPFHLGHLWLIRHALQSVDRLIIGVGSANIKNHDNNFLTYEQRKEMLEMVFEKEDLKDKLIKIVPLNDYFNDEVWFKKTIEKTGPVDVVVGNNQWTNGIFEARGYPILRVGYYKRFFYEGEKIRKLLKYTYSQRSLPIGKSWEDRVPPYLVSIIKTNYQLPVTNYQFHHIVFGGTFNHFHRGHRKMLDLAFSLGKKVSLGITTKKLYQDKFLSGTIEDIKVRKKAVEEYLLAKKWRDRTQFFYIADIYGPSATDKTIDAVLVSKATYKNAKKINQVREELKLPPLKIVVAPDVTADDGQLITSERIRAGQIDREGNPYEAVFKNKKLLKLPKYLRSRLRVPLGKTFLGREEEWQKVAERVLRYINIMERVMVIAVGDIIAMSLEKVGFIPDVKIIDFRSRRKAIESIASASSGLKSSKQVSSLINIAGTININTSLELKKTIQKAVMEKKKYWFIVEGEEDLLALPAILFAPLGSVVLYGQMDLGVVAVTVTEEKKKEALILIKKFV